MLEAEVKLRIDENELARLRQRLLELDASPDPPLDQSDLYFAHPTRDFASTDEALRLREDARGLRITYKGPKLDPPRKTREEIEFPLSTSLATATSLLEKLGFSTVARVTKARADYRIGPPHSAVVSIDVIAGLGTFCEVEVDCESIEAGRRALESMLERLGLDHLPVIQESYLEMLLTAGRA